MDLGILSKQLETLPASGLTLELKKTAAFFSNGESTYGVFYALSVVYLLFFLFLCVAIINLALAVSIEKWPFIFIIIFIIIFFIWYCWNLFQKHFLLNHPDSIKKLVFTELGWCYVQLKNSKIFKADISADTILTEYLVILNLTPWDEEGSYSILSKIKTKLFFRNSSVLISVDRLDDSEKFREIKRYLRFISFIKKEDELE